MVEDVNADDAGGHLDLLPIAATEWKDTERDRADKGWVWGSGEDSDSAQIVAMRDGRGHPGSGTRRAGV